MTCTCRWCPCRWRSLSWRRWTCRRTPRTPRSCPTPSTWPPSGRASRIWSVSSLFDHRGKREFEDECFANFSSSKIRTFIFFYVLKFILEYFNWIRLVFSFWIFRSSPARRTKILTTIRSFVSYAVLPTHGGGAVRRALPGVERGAVQRAALAHRAPGASRHRPAATHHQVSPKKFRLNNIYLARSIVTLHKQEPKRTFSVHFYSITRATLLLWQYSIF